MTQPTISLHILWRTTLASLHHFCCILMGIHYLDPMQDCNSFGVFVDPECFWVRQIGGFSPIISCTSYFFVDGMMGAQFGVLSLLPLIVQRQRTVHNHLMVATLSICKPCFYRQEVQNPYFRITPLCSNSVAQILKRKHRSGSYVS